MTVNSPWLYSALCEEAGVFGEFEKCLTFCSKLQSAQSGYAVPAGLSDQYPSEKKSFLSEQDVNHYLETSQKAAWDVFIIAFTSPNAGKNGQFPLSVSRGLFEHISSAFSISPAFLSVCNTGVARYISPTTQNEIAKDIEQAQFIVQQNRSYFSHSIAITFNMKTGQVRALIFGTEGSLSELFDCLDYISPLPYGPLIIPTIALELQVKLFNDTIKTCQSQIRKIECLTGMRQFNHAHESTDRTTQDWRSLDLIDITHDLSGFLSRFAFLKLQAETGAYLVHQLHLSAEHLIVKLQSQKEQRSKIDSQHAIISQLANTESWYLGVQARCRYLTERTQAQVQTVYNLIASQDSLSSISIARASHDVAEASRRDNQLMLQIAKDSRAIAVSTAKDSAAMKIIAAVTILFLPATFTATYFSMTFFDFTGDTRGPRASPWIWVYFLTTMLLTGVIQIFWAVLSSTREKEAPRASLMG